VIIESFPVGPLQCNCTILGCPRTQEALVVDPGGDAPRILESLKRHGLRCVAIAHTHAHFDHVMATGELQEATGARVSLHPEDAFLYDDLAAQLTWVGMPRMPIPPAPPVDAPLEDKQELVFGESSSLVIHSPGHTPGSVCFSCRVDDRMLLLSGDSLFRQGIGRTDFPGGDHDQLQASIRERLLVLDGETRVIPGHGPETTIEFERHSNPFLR
jgi:hydroxyacylglutathione hydrolase